jgi:hypothetical protein
MRELPVVGRVIPGRVSLYAPALIGVIVLIGIATLIRGEARLIGLYVLLTILGICLTPWPQQWARYWSPAMPFLMLALACGLTTLAAWSERLPSPARRMSHAARIALIATILVVEAVSIVRIYAHYRFPATFRDRDGHAVTQDLFFYSQTYQALDAGLDWLASQARPDDVVAASMPQWAYLRTGLKSVMPPFETDPVRTQALLDSVPIRFVVVDGTDVNFTREYTLPSLVSAPDRWTLVYSNPSGGLEIYQRRSEPARSDRP